MYKTQSYPHEGICSHVKCSRLDNNFVKCEGCGHSFVKPATALENKKCQAFIKDSKFTPAKFDNKLSNNFPVLHFSDKSNLNKLIFRRKDDGFFDAKLNGIRMTLTQEELKCIIKAAKMTKT
jgi:hypothetical protein